MGWDINRLTIVGRLSRDPELKYTPSGTAVCNFGLAVGEKPAQDGSDSVSFFDCTAWGKTAENLATYKQKGGQIILDGRITQKTWTSQEGQKRSKVEIVADRIEYIGNKPAGQQEAEPAGQPGYTIDQQQDGSFYNQ
jgi:single-strand DNA-binding protein